MPISLPAVSASPVSPASVQGQADDGGFDLGKLLDAGRRNGAFDLMQNLGIGLMCTRGVGPALAVGLKLNEDQQAKRSVADLAQAEFGLKARKAGQEIAGQNATVAFLTSKGIPQADAVSMVQAAAGGNREALNNALQNAVPRVDAGSGYTMQGGRAVAIPGGPQDVETIKSQTEARREDKTQTPLTDPETRAAAGIAPNDRRPAWSDPDGKVTFDSGPKAQTATMIGPDGTKATRVYNQTTGVFDAPDYGSNPPRSSIDTSGVPAGVDPATYRKELAKATVAEQRSASQRATQAGDALSVLDRAQAAYERLAKNDGIGPISASAPSRMAAGVFGRQNEIDRQEYEAAAKRLELLQAQISMKGQGSVTDSERRLLAYTLPRLDAASPETGLNTLRDMRSQFSRSMSADRLPSYGAGRSEPAALITPAQPSREAMEAEARRRGLIR